MSAVDFDKCQEFVMVTLAYTNTKPTLSFSAIEDLERKAAIILQERGGDITKLQSKITRGKISVWCEKKPEK